ncbi:MAG: hypothetical protein GSR86_04505 [Desulfurococcales archaeon]|nr:hypothetical protein [Desulfurococcales archaeon]
MIDILVTATLIYTGKEVIREGYVYVKGGRIAGVGQMPIPEDLTYATLQLGGEGRIVVPGLVAVLDAAAYPIRFYRPSMRKRIEFYKLLSPEDLARLSLPAVYEAHLSGITSILVEGLDPSLPNRLRDMVGGIYGLAKPGCLEDGQGGDYVRVSDESCPGGVRIDSGEVLALSSKPAYTLASVEDPYKLSLGLRRQAGLGSQEIRPGETAEIAIYDASRPPGMLMEYAPLDVIERIYVYGRVESLIAADSVLVDGHEHIVISDKDLREARKASIRLLSSR